MAFASSKLLNSLGISGVVITALLSPCCLPLFAVVGTTLGVGSFEPFGDKSMLVFEGMMFLSVSGLALSFRKHRCWYPLLLAIPALLVVAFSYHFWDSENWQHGVYAGMTLMFAATGVNMYRNKLDNDCCGTAENSKDMRGLKLESTITCPGCGHSRTEIMPTNACSYFYECEKCKAVLKPKHGDCCVYCSYGTEKCPPMQQGNGCC